MSWSVQATGKGEALVNELTRQFEQSEKNCSSIPQEAETVAKLKEAVITCISGTSQFVTIAAYGSAYRVGDELKQNSFSVTMTLHGDNIYV